MDPPGRLPLPSPEKALSRTKSVNQYPCSTSCQYDTYTHAKNHGTSAKVPSQDYRSQMRRLRQSDYNNLSRNQEIPKQSFFHARCPFAKMRLFYPDTIIFSRIKSFYHIYPIKSIKAARFRLAAFTPAVRSKSVSCCLFCILLHSFDIKPNLIRNTCNVFTVCRSSSA